MSRKSDEARKPSMNQPLFVKLSLLATALALVVVVLGAYVRLNNAGLGCPDWPGCYGHLTVPTSSHAVAKADQAYPHRPVEAHKAWKEMIHRYFAGTLGLIVFALAAIAWWRRRHGVPDQLVGVPSFLVVLIVFQALLGMWTVTLLVSPPIVMAHLLGGMTTLALLWWLSLRQSGLLAAQGGVDQAIRRLRPWALAGLVILVCQLALGGWTSANYAALVCPDFPTCQGQWWPHMDFSDAFTLWHTTGVNYEGGVLPNDARVAIHVTHRLGALVTFLFLGTLGMATLRAPVGRAARRIGAVLLVVLLAQVSLGIANVELSLPLPVAVAHNGVAALLLLTVVALNHSLRPRKTRTHI